MPWGACAACVTARAWAACHLQHAARWCQRPQPRRRAGVRVRGARGICAYTSLSVVHCSLLFTTCLGAACTPRPYGAKCQNRGSGRALALASRPQAPARITRSTSRASRCRVAAARGGAVVEAEAKPSRGTTAHRVTSLKPCTSPTAARQRRVLNATPRACAHLMRVSANLGIQNSLTSFILGRRSSRTTPFGPYRR